MTDKLLISIHTIPDGFADSVRLQKYVSEVFRSILVSNKAAKKRIKQGCVFVNGSPEPTSYWVQPGDEIELYEPVHSRPKPYHLHMPIVYEDDYLAVINKPAGINVSGNSYRTVQNALMDLITPSEATGKLPWPRPVHRLDNQTRGLLVIAKTQETLVELGNMFRLRTVRKTYVALVMGKTPASGVFNSAVDGLEAKTSFNTIKTVRSLRSGYISLVNLIPETGRTHQLRIHTSINGFPILGDKLYGPENKTLEHKGMFLCASRLVFDHPVTRKAIDLDLGIPDKFLTRLVHEENRWKKFNH